MNRSELEVPEGPILDYVLGDLSGDDAREFERRLTADPELAREVERLRGVLGLLPYAKVTEPPPDLRAAVLQASAEARREREAKRPARRRPTWSTVGLAAAALLALAFGIDAYRLRRELRLERSVTAMLREPNIVRSFQLAGTTSSAIGTVALDLDAARGALVVERLPVLPAGRVYRLWARVGDKDVLCGHFKPGSDGKVLAQFPIPVDSYTAPISRLFLTAEDATAPAQPSGPTVMESA